MSLKTRVILVLVIGTVMCLGLSYSGGLVVDKQPSGHDDAALTQAKLFTEVLDRVKREYVEPIDDRELLESAIRGMVGDLDAHSQYLDADEYREIRISTSGSFTGVGVEVSEVGETAA